jgi:homoaconitate hydratase family protein/3-isopropylmalate dehydratase small subunit
MGMTMIEKILAGHSTAETTGPGDIIDVEIDARVARDFGGANVVKNIRENNLEIDDPGRTFFTFDCNPTGSDQKYAANQHICRVFAKEYGIKVYDINTGIGTHLMIEEGLAYPGATAVSTDSHANILGAIGAFGQGMGDKDIAAAWSSGKVWFKVPETVKMTIRGKLPSSVSAKDMVLNLLALYGANTFLGRVIELYGDAVDSLSLDMRITIASMATELGAVSILIPPNTEVIRYCESRVARKIEAVEADPDAGYAEEIEIDASGFTTMVSRPGKPHDAVPVKELQGIHIHSAFIGSCTNGRMEDLRTAAAVLRDHKVAKGVVLKIVPSTDRIWNLCLEEGLLEVFKDAGAMVSNPGCAGCAAGQVGQNGPGEVTVSSGNRNFPGKQGQGEVYLASPEIVAASAVAGFLTSPDLIPEGKIEERPEETEGWEDTEEGLPGETSPAKTTKVKSPGKPATAAGKPDASPTEFKGMAWHIDQDDIDTDMIFHNRHLTITDIREMGKHALGNLDGYESFAGKVKKGDILFVGRNFGAGSSRQQAVDCFVSLGVSCIVAGSFGAIYERNAINAAFPILVSEDIGKLELKEGDPVCLNIASGEIRNERSGKQISASPFSEVQMEIYQRGGLF